LIDKQNGGGGGGEAEREDIITMMIDTTGTDEMRERERGLTMKTSFPTDDY
jgi:hypothetical protein